MPSYQPYHDIPAIEYGDSGVMSDPFAANGHIEEYSDYWRSQPSPLWSHQSIEGNNPASMHHLLSLERHLLSLTHSANGHPGLLPVKTPEHELSRLSIHSSFSANSQSYRGLRYLSPSGMLGGGSLSSEGSTSECASSPDAARHATKLFQSPFESQDGYRSPSYNESYGSGHGNWIPQSVYQHSLIESPSSYGHETACNLKDLQYTPDADLEDPLEDNDCIKVELRYPEELALSQVATPTSTGASYGVSGRDDASLKGEDDDDDKHPENDSDQDPDFNPRRPQRTLSNQVKFPSRKAPKRTRSTTGSTAAILGTDSKITKSSHRKPSASNTAPARQSKNSDDSKRNFTCAFSFWGCATTFGSKNEWKRHVASQHLQLDFYRCDTGSCVPDSQHGGRNDVVTYNDFNRKDLFTQHHRRMHTPWSAGQPSTKTRVDFEAGLEAVRKRCLRERRKAPARSTCGFCRKVFGLWEDRMEHVGKHFEGKEREGEDGPDVEEEEEDEDLRDWAVREGIVKNCGEKGFWLAGMEPSGGRAGRRPRSERAQRRPAVQDHNVDEDMDAHGEEE